MWQTLVAPSELGDIAGPEALLVSLMGSPYRCGSRSWVEGWGRSLDHHSMVLMGIREHSFEGRFGGWVPLGQLV